MSIPTCETKLFFSALAISIIFMNWSGAAENSIFYAIKSIAENGELSIDPFANMTSDRAYFNGHYYSDKEPGIILAGVSIYTISNYIFLGNNELMKILLTFWLSSVPFSIMMVLIYRISSAFAPRSKYTPVILTGFCSIIFQSSLALLGTTLSTMLVFYSFYNIFQMKKDKAPDTKRIIVSGFSCGLAVTCSIVSLIGVFLMSFYLFLSNRKQIGKFLFAILLGMAPLFAYNLIIFGTPFTLPRLYLDPYAWSQSQISDYQGIIQPNPVIIPEPDPIVFLKLLFYPEKGIFFYYPVLLLAIPGFYTLYKSGYKKESLYILIFFCLLLLFNSSLHASWSGGTYFGPRHLAYIVPFLSLPISSFVNLGRFKKIIVVLAAYSLFVNFVGLQPHIDISENIEIKTLNSFDITSNPIYSYYLPRFLSYGPRSRIIEDLVNFRIPTITFSFGNREEFTSFNGYYPFLPVFILGFILLSVWWSDFWRRFGDMIYDNRYEIIILSAILLYIITISVQTLNIENGWYPQSSNEVGRWMRQDGVMPIFSDFSGETLLKFVLDSYNDSRKVDFYFNGRFVDSFIAETGPTIEQSFIVNASLGLNTLKFHAEPDCVSPSDVEGTSDVRCISLHLWNWDVTELNGTWAYGKYWYSKSENEEGRWVAQNATLLLFPSGPTKFNLTFWSMLVNRTMNIYLNEELLTTLIAENNTKQTYMSPTISSSSTLRFETVGDCVVPADLEFGAWDDRRCLGIQMSDFILPDVGAECNSPQI